MMILAKRLGLVVNGLGDDVRTCQTEEIYHEKRSTTSKDTSQRGLVRNLAWVWINLKLLIGSSINN